MAPERVLIVTEKIAAITRPSKPVGRYCLMKVANSSSLVNVPAVVEHPEADTDHQKQGELRQDNEPACDQGPTRLAFGSCREVALDHHLIRSMRTRCRAPGHRSHRPRSCTASTGSRRARPTSLGQTRRSRPAPHFQNSRTGTCPPPDLLAQTVAHPPGISCRRMPRANPAAIR